VNGDFRNVMSQIFPLADPQWRPFDMRRGQHSRTNATGQELACRAPTPSYEPNVPYPVSCSDDYRFTLSKHLCASVRAAVAHWPGKAARCVPSRWCREQALSTGPTFWTRCLIEHWQAVCTALLVFVAGN